MASLPNLPYTDDEKVKSDLLRQKDEQIQSLSQKVDFFQVYLKEMHHRIKNQLSTVITLFRLQRRYTGDAQLAMFLNDCESRVLSITLMHDHLNQLGRAEKCSCQHFIDRMIREMKIIYKFEDKDIRIIRQIDDIPLQPECMMPCGLIITELVTNSIKYAFPESWKGDPEIRISITQDSEWINIKVCDNGVGFELSESYSDSQSLGIQIITMLVEQQLKGTITIKGCQGTCITIKFKNTH